MQMYRKDRKDSLGLEPERISSPCWLRLDAHFGGEDRRTSCDHVGGALSFDQRHTHIARACNEDWIREALTQFLVFSHIFVLNLQKTT